MEQIGIALTGLLAIWLTQHKKVAYQRFACIFGLARQPFWFYSAYQGQQWGIFYSASSIPWPGPTASKLTGYVPTN
jgi:hypothetical protein